MSGPSDPVLGPNLSVREMNKFVACGDETAVRTVICDESGSLGSGSGYMFPASADDARYYDDFRASTPGIEQTVLSTTLSGENVYLTRLNVQCRKRGVWRIEIGGSEIGAVSTGAGDGTNEFTWNPPRKVTDGSLVEVKFTQTGGSSTDVRTNLMGFKGV